MRINKEIVKLIVAIIATVVLVVLLIGELWAEHSECTSRGGVMIRNAYNVPVCVVLPKYSERN